VNGEDVNLEQVEAGMAWHYKKYRGEQSASDRIKYSDAELEAKIQKVGLWRDPNPVPPRDYRQAERDRRNSLEPFVGKSTTHGAELARICVTSETYPETGGMSCVGPKPNMPPFQDYDRNAAILAVPEKKKRHEGRNIAASR
jgi:hypothetical protein